MIGSTLTTTTTASGPRSRGPDPENRGQNDGGQATVEVALILPVLATMLLAVVQVGLVVRDQILVTHAAREAARVAAVDPSSGAPRSAAIDGSGLGPGRLTVETSGRGPAGSRVRVEVAYRTPTDVPLVGRLLSDLTLHSSASMRVETE